jgi:hypothetical protein
MAQPVIVFNAEFLVGVPVVGYADGCNVASLHAYSVKKNAATMQGELFAEMGKWRV